MSGPNLDGWVPVRLYRSSSCLMADWCYLGDFRFTHPFFEQSLQQALRHPFRVLFRHQTPAELLIQRAVTHPGIGPTGFIFHMSRCGSTLISQMLAASGRNVVVSEAAPVHSALYAEKLDPAMDETRKVALLRGMIHALGHPRAGAERRYFVKFDCWHTLDLALVRRAFPDVPWVFVYRDPVEVLESQSREPAAWTVPGMVPIHGLDSSPADCAANRMEYAARILQAICQAARGRIGDGGLALNYSDLPDAVFGRLAAHFGCTWDERESALLRAASRLDAKSPQSLFTPNAAREPAEASPQVRDLAARYMCGVLDSLRRT